MPKRLKPLSSPLVGLSFQCRLTETLARFAISAGKKEAAVKAVSEAFSKLLSEFKEDPAVVARHIEANALVKVGFFRRRMGSRTHSIPYMMDDDRAYRHSMKRIHKLVKVQARGLPAKLNRPGRKGKPYSQALYEELRELLRAKGRVVEEKLRIYARAQGSRGLSHLISSFKLSDPERALKLDLEPRFAASQSGEELS